MFRKMKNFIEYFQYLNNPISALLFKFGLKNTYKIRVKNSSYEIIINNVSSLNNLMHNLKYVSNEKIREYLDYIKEIDQDLEYVNVGGIKYINILNSNFKKNSIYNYAICIDEYFFGDEWDMINPSERNVIDIGGNNGDTALYFAKKGATVIGFEPVKHLYDLAMENFSLNKDLENKITFINKAVGSKRGKLEITADSVKDYIDHEPYDMEVITLMDIIEEYNFIPDVLKMDCEGCEFEIIQNNDLTMFNEIVFEHHSMITGKDYNNLITTLKKQGFKINIYPIKGYEFKDVGIIYAYK